MKPCKQWKRPNWNRFKSKRRHTHPIHSDLTYSTVTIHFQHHQQNYDEWDIWMWETSTQQQRTIPFTKQDEFGGQAIFQVKTGTTFGYIIRKKDWSDRNHPNDQFLTIHQETEVWIYENQEGVGPIPDSAADLQLIFHYYRFNHDYSHWNIWAWFTETGGGFEIPFIQEDEFGKIAKLNLKNHQLQSSLGFVLRQGDWFNRDTEFNRLIDFSTLKQKNKPVQHHIYLIEGDEGIHPSPTIDKTPSLKGTTFTSLTTLKTTAFVPFNQTDDITITDEFGISLPIEHVHISENQRWLYLTLTHPIELGQPYFLSINGFKPNQSIEFFGLYDTSDFEPYHYNGNDLGATYSKEQTTFKVWSPVAKEVKLCLYRTGHLDDLLGVFPMKRKEQGIWELTRYGDLNQVYYTYQVTVGTQTEEAVDPYARALGVNGKRGMVIDLSKTHPASWETETSPEFSGHLTDAIIYETHLRDLSTHTDSGIKHIGKYLQFTETGTKNKEGYSTGIDHLKEMGITHLHILPFFDFSSVDESNLETPQYNWGYDPHHYNVPEGSYSTNPYQGDIRIKETKQMIQSLHQQGIRVVMDVVYNHTSAGFNSDFNKLVPGYYYRQHEEGSFSNGSGCGNETASNRFMMRKFMIDSVIYWATEYHLDGFRFDLMALHDTHTLNSIQEALHQIDPTIIIYGEGWTGGSSLLHSDQAAFKWNAHQTPRIAYFNDDLRDAIKGSTGNECEAGYICGNHSYDTHQYLKFGIAGSCYHDQIPNQHFWATSPSQSVNYVSAHDNHTLFDKLLAVELNRQDNPPLDYLKQLQKQANAIVLTSQGVPFLHAGVEMLRTKGGNHNSYNANDHINQLDWGLKSQFSDVVAYYQGLIQLRKANPAFRMKTQEEVIRHLRFHDYVPVGVTFFSITDDSTNRLSELTVVIHNTTSYHQRLSLPRDGKWHIVVDDKKAGTTPLHTFNGNEVKLPPHSTFVLLLH